MLVEIKPGNLKGRRKCIFDAFSFSRPPEQTAPVYVLLNVWGITEIKLTAILSSHQQEELAKILIIEGKPWIRAKQHQCIWEQMNMINLSLNLIAFIQQNNIPLEVNQSRALAHAVVVIESQHQRQQCESYSPFTSQLWFIQRLLVWFAWQAGDFWWKTHHASSAGCRCQPRAALPEALGLWEPLGASRQQCWHNSGEPFPTATTEQKLEPVHSTSLINLKQQ